MTCATKNDHVHGVKRTICGLKMSGEMTSVVSWRSGKSYGVFEKTKGEGDSEI